MTGGTARSRASTRYFLTLARDAAVASEIARRRMKLPSFQCDGPCACRTEAEHEEGQRLQAQFRAQFGIPSDECVGCYLGDDGPSVHDYDYGCQYGKGAGF